MTDPAPLLTSDVPRSPGWQTSWSPPSGNMRLLGRRGGRAALRSISCRMWAAMGVMSLCILLLLLSLLDNSDLHECACGWKEATEQRVAKYIDRLMTNTDPTTNRSALAETEASHPSLALGFLVRQERRGERCHNTPGVFSVRHSNTLWQRADLGHDTFLLYGAYYDHREAGDPKVRVLVMVDSARPPTPTCHLWYPGDIAPTAVKASRIDYLHWQERLDGAWLPYLVTCSAGSWRRSPPQVVALVPYACAPATNALRVFRHQGSQPKGNLALCHKFLFDPTQDYSRRLVEWLEAARAWGVDEVTFYDASTHPNVRAVLTHYEREGYVKVMPWSSPGDQPSLPHLYRTLYDTQRYTLFTTENIPYTDCLLRHIASHRYVGVWDLDEFLLPASHSSLPDMLDAAKARADVQGLHPTSYLARCSYYFDDQVEQASSVLPEYLHLLRHVTRSVKLTPPAVFTKAVHDTSLALGLHAHFALLTVKGPIDRGRDLYHLYPGSEGHLAHYRATCQGEDQTECLAEYRPFLTRDTAMWRQRYPITRGTKAVLRALHLLPPPSP